MNNTQKVCLVLFVINVIVRNGLYIVLYIYASLNYFIVPFLILSDTVTYATATVFLMSKLITINKSRDKCTLQDNIKVVRVTEKLKEIKEKYQNYNDGKNKCVKISGLEEERKLNSLVVQD